MLYVNVSLVQNTAVPYLFNEMTEKRVWKNQNSRTD